MDPKHDRYSESIVPGEVFWGIGVENETYLQLKCTLQSPDLFKDRKRERYSVNYWSQYKPEQLEAALQSLDTSTPLPVLLNSHSFLKCDRHGEHKTTYTTNPRPNPKYRGTSLFEDLSGVCPEIFGDGQKDVWWTFDGDTIEFMTQQYYCAKLEDVIEELIQAKQAWLHGFRTAIKQFSDRERILHAVPQWPTHNFGFAAMATNRTHVAIFNNGTYHLNLTMPTCLDKEGNIADWDLFEHRHQKASRLFQWITPFLVAKWGSPDPLSQINRQYPAGSQRLTASRYVSVGTYDTKTMPRGKLLIKPASELPYKTWWSHLYANTRCGYAPLETLGFDINFNKFRNHGLEFRIFDWFPEAGLEEVLRLLIWMLDVADSYTSVPIPQESEAWNRVMESCLWNGVDACLSPADCAAFRTVLGISSLQPLPWGGLTAMDVYTRLVADWAEKWDGRGACSRRMIRRPLVRPQTPKLEWMSETAPSSRSNHVSTLVRFQKTQQWKRRSLYTNWCCTQ